MRSGSFFFSACRVHRVMEGSQSLASIVFLGPRILGPLLRPAGPCREFGSGRKKEPHASCHRGADPHVPHLGLQLGPRQGGDAACLALRLLGHPHDRRRHHPPGGPGMAGASPAASKRPHDPSRGNPLHDVLCGICHVGPRRGGRGENGHPGVCDAVLAHPDGLAASG